MVRYSTRRRFLTGAATAGTIAAAGCLGSDDGDDAPYEIWALDQGTDTIYVYGPADDDFEHVETIDFEADLGLEFGQVPHMIDFSSDHEYAAVACTTGARTLVFRTEDRELVGNVETGGGSHFAGFTPNDEYIQVDVIGERTIARVDADLEDEDFEVTDEISFADEPSLDDEVFADSSPVCHDYAGGQSYHTLGPSLHDGGLVVLDVDAFEIAEVISPDRIRANCGTIAHPSEEKFYLTAGIPSNDEETGGVGEWYVLDTDENLPYGPDGEIVEEYAHEDVARDSDGYDAHGFWFVGDGDDRELWILNRETDDGLVIDPETDEVKAEIDDYGTAPDIMAGSPDDEHLFVTLRGPEPLSGDPHAAEGETPGFSVVSTEDREVERVVQPDEDDSDSDFHGIGVVVK